MTEIEILRAMQSDLAGLRADVHKLDAKVDAVTKEVTGHTRVLNVLLQDVRLIRGATDDAAALRVTAGEIGAMHHDINRVQMGLAALEARVEVIEGRNGTARPELRSASLPRLRGPQARLPMSSTHDGAIQDLPVRWKGQPRMTRGQVRALSGLHALGTENPTP
jgi:hypothetical protein